jgi:hypothetical protein
MKSSRFLPAIVPVLAGLLVPTIAFFAAQHINGYVPGEDGDVDDAVAQVAGGLPLVTAFTIPGFLGLALFLFFMGDRFGSRFLWAVSLVGTGTLAVLVFGPHSSMYELLYSRGRMHSTTGIGIMFVSFYCAIAAAAIAFAARLAGNRWGSARFSRGRVP